jgi:uncharacterized protein (UPF0305 family)
VKKIKQTDKLNEWIDDRRIDRKKEGKEEGREKGTENDKKRTKVEYIVCIYVINIMKPPCTINVF